MASIPTERRTAIEERIAELVNEQFNQDPANRIRTILGVAVKKKALEHVGTLCRRHTSMNGELLRAVQGSVKHHEDAGTDNTADGKAAALVLEALMDVLPPEPEIKKPEVPEHLPQFRDYSRKFIPHSGVAVKGGADAHELRYHIGRQHAVPPGDEGCAIGWLKQQTPHKVRHHLDAMWEVLAPEAKKRMALLAAGEYHGLEPDAVREQLMVEGIYDGVTIRGGYLNSGADAQQYSHAYFDPANYQQMVKPYMEHQLSLVTPKATEMPETAQHVPSFAQEQYHSFTSIEESTRGVLSTLRADLLHALADEREKVEKGLAQKRDDGGYNVTIGDKDTGEITLALVDARHGNQTRLYIHHDSLNDYFALRGRYVRTYRVHLTDEHNPGLSR